MSNLTTKLAEYEDYELAFIVAYKMETFTDVVAMQVQDEADKRSLTKESMNALVQEKLEVEIRDHNQKICPRCTSKNILTNIEEFHGNNKAFGLDSGKPLTSIEYKVCGVCGWNFLTDETSHEKRSRMTTNLVSVVVSVIFILLLTYIIHWAIN